MRIPVLTYHAMAMAGNDPRSNDHHALAADLEVIEREGFEVRPLHELVAAWLRSPRTLLGRKLIALTCDDGPDFDFRDIEHPQWGPQRSFLNILRDFHAAHPGRQPGLHITSFVVASPRDRAVLDRVCMLGRGWWRDDWWLDAIASGRMGIASHSWDHNHLALANTRFPHVARGVFTNIDSREVADFQVEQAARFLRRHAPNPSARLFAYPYGPHSEYLVREYFPQRAAAIGVDAALGDDPTPWHASSNRWEIPRYVHGRDWHDPSDLAALLRNA